MTSLVLALALTFCPGAVDDPVVFEHVRAVTLGPSGILEDATVVVEGDRITAVGPAGEVSAPEGARRIDGRGFTLVPGLVDLHVHVGDAVDLELYAVAGVTTVRELNGGLDHLALRDRVRSGALLGPELHVGSPTINGVHDPEAARAVAREQAARGFEFLKIYGDISESAYAALVEEARARGLKPCGHIPRNLRLEQVLATPPDSIDHAEEFLYGWFDGRHGRDSIPELTRLVRASGVAVVTTLSCYDRIGRQVANFSRAFDEGSVRYASAYSRYRWAPANNTYRRFARADVPALRRSLALQREFLAAFHAAGVPVLMGTDSGSEGVPFVMPGFSAHEELERLTECGLSNEEALAAASREAARFLGVLDEVGTLEVGKRADLMLLMGDPLQDIRDTTLRAGVMVRGRWVPAEEVDAILERIAEQSRREEVFFERLAAGGPAAAEAWYEECVAADGGIPFREDSLNELGYEALILDDDVDLAVALFRLNVRAYPLSWNVHDSLGEALWSQGRREPALAAYRESVRLEPRHVDGLRTIAELERELQGESEGGRAPR